MSLIQINRHAESEPTKLQKNPWDFGNPWDLVCHFEI